jgi:stalled ribosome rescue protein Dom34
LTIYHNTIKKDKVITYVYSNEDDVWFVNKITKRRDLCIGKTCGPMRIKELIFTGMRGKI